MSVDKISGVLETLPANMKMETKKEHASQSQTKVVVDKVSLDNGGDRVDLTAISYPPLLPVGDTQSIYKSKK